MPWNMNMNEEDQGGDEPEDCYPVCTLRLGYCTGEPTDGDNSGISLDTRKHQLRELQNGKP